MSDTAIEWTDKVWNPTTGCDRVSAGCDHCYALTLAKRLKAMGSPKYQNDGGPRSGPGFAPTMHYQSLDEPLKWRKPRKVFVNSMSDLFHEDISDEFIADVWHVMAKTPQHTYQILTKRHGRMRSWSRKWHSHPEWSTPLPNVWLGVSVEDQKTANLRIPALINTPAAVRFLSCEPLLGPINLYPHMPMEDYREPRDTEEWAIHWVIAGGESGPDARPVDPEWIRSLRDQCNDVQVAFLFKQWGGRTPKAGGRELDGRMWDEYPGGVV